MKMFKFTLTDPKRSKPEYRVLPVHLSPQLQRQIRALSSMNMRSHGQESQLSCIHSARPWNWTELPLTVTPHSSHSRKGQELWYFLPCCGAQITQRHHEKKLTYNFLNICYCSRFLPPVSWQGLVLRTWCGFKPIVWLLLQPDRARTCQLWLRRVSVYYLPDASNALLLKATIQGSRSGFGQTDRQSDSKRPIWHWGMER